MKLALPFLKNFKTAFIQKIAATVRFSKMFANCRILFLQPNNLNIDDKYLFLIAREPKNVPGKYVKK